MNNLANVLGIGAYFTILLVLAIAVETILEPITYIKWPRKKINPEDFAKELKNWAPTNFGAEVKIEEIANLTNLWRSFSQRSP